MDDGDDDEGIDNDGNILRDGEDIRTTKRVHCHVILFNQLSLHDHICFDLFLFCSCFLDNVNFVKKLQRKVITG